jgi:predicted AAA+ superfamily ATPase
MATSSPKKPKAEMAAALGKSTAKTLEDKISAAHQTIKNAILVPTAKAAKNCSIADAYSLSTKAVSGYATLDKKHIYDIQSLVTSIRLYANDRSKRRPLNILLHAAPGAGKSHLVECLAKLLTDERVKDVSFNMTSMRGIDDLAAPIDQVRDLKVADRLPLLFLDEFDSNSDNFARLLPLLWDGKVDVGGRLLQTGKMVVILAGSSKRIGEISIAAKSMRDVSQKEDGKLVDLISRINGGEISIPDLDEISESRNRRVDKVCLAVALLRQRFGGSLLRVPWALLRFIADTKFKHGSRSIATLLDLIPMTNTTSGELALDELTLPLSSESALINSCLIFHLKETTVKETIKCWTSLSASAAVVTIAKAETGWTRLLGLAEKELESYLTAKTQPPRNTR